MLKAFKPLIIWILIIGVAHLALTITFGSAISTLLDNQTINGIQLYTFDFSSYLENIASSMGDIGNYLEITLPTRTWQATDSISDVGENIALMIDYIIMLINVIAIYPFKLVAYMVNIFISVLGINIASGPLEWMGTIFDTLSSENFKIPYI